MKQTYPAFLVKIGFHIFCPNRQVLNPFPNKPLFLRVCSITLLKAQWKKEKLLVMSNFFFSQLDLYPFGKLSAIIINITTVVCKLFQFGGVLNLLFGKGLN